MKSHAKYVDAKSEWLDAAPAHWRMARLNQVAIAWPSNVDKHSVPGEQTIRLCNYTDVYKNEAIVDGINFMKATASLIQIERFRIKIGDTLITKDSETADDIGVPAFVRVAADDLVCGYHLSIVRPNVSTVQPRFLFWSLSSQPIRNQWAVLASGVTRVGIRSGDLAKAELALPPIDEQRAIADFLDRETARIDTLIEEQQRLIELVRERRTAAVAAATANLTDLTWLKHRAVVQSGVTLNGEGDSAWPEWPYLRVANVQIGRLDLNEIKTVRLSPDAAASSKLRHGDVVMTEGGDIDKLGRGALWTSEIPDALHQNHIFAVRPDERLLPEFLVYWLDGPDARNYFRTTAKQTTNLAAINKWILGNMPLACPPVEEQRRLVEYLDEQTAKIDALIAETEKFIELSRERRSALITAAVTGQIDVREAA